MKSYGRTVKLRSIGFAYEYPFRFMLVARYTKREPLVMIKNTIFDGQSKPFNLLRSFSLLSLMIITLTTGVSGILLSRFLSKNMIARDAEITSQFVQSVAEINDPSVYFAHRRPTSNQSVTDDASTRTSLNASKAALEEFFSHIVAMPEVVRANVYDDEKRIIWSSRKHLIGKQFPDNPELQEALSGQLSIKTGTVKELRKSEHVDFEATVSQFIENYIPIWRPTGDRVVGVVEVYRVPLALFRAIARGNRLVWGSAVIGGVFLYGSLFWIVRRATNVMQRQQQQLIESETMATVGEMTSAITHNLRNSLASIRSSAEIAATSDEVPPCRETVTDIITVVDQLEHWIRTLFTYARPLQPVPTPVEIDTVLQDTLRGFQTILMHQGIKLEWRPAQTLPPVLADANLIQQACHILITNAVEAMPTGGTLKVCSKLAANGRSIQVHISDTGPGIPPEQMERVFRPFFTTKRKGLGVGLALAKRIVERHGGTITLSSQPDHGATVALDFPLME